MRLLKHISMRRSSRARAGFTLPEAMITVLIFALIVGACLLVLVSGNESWRMNSLQIELQQELRKGLSWISEDLRQAGSNSITNVPADGNWYTTITFRTASDVSGGTIQWSAYTITYVLGGTNTNQLLRTLSTGTTKTVSQNISTLRFRRQAATPNIVEIQLRARNLGLTSKWQNVEDFLNGQVRLRN